MPGGSSLSRGNELFAQVVYNSAVAIPTIGAAATVTNTATLNGLLIGDLVSWNLVGAGIVGISVANMYVSANNTLSITWENNTAGSLGPGTAAFLFEVVRPENFVEGGYAILPTAIV